MSIETFTDITSNTHGQQLILELTSNPLQERSHLDTAITFMGAFFGMQNCSKVLKGGQEISYPNFSRWLLAGLAEWQQRRSLELQSLSWWQKALSPEVLFSQFLNWRGAFWMCSWINHEFIWLLINPPVSLLKWAQICFAFFISGLKSWFTMVKTGVMGRDEDCSEGLRYT